MAVVDISNLSKSDQEAVREASRTGDYSKVSEEGLRIITDTAYDTSDVVFRQVERGLSSSTRGVARMFGLDPQSDQDAERHQIRCRPRRIHTRGRGPCKCCYPCSPLQRYTYTTHAARRIVLARAVLAI